MKPIVPEGEALRHAIQWLSEQSRHDVETVEQAARRFDLSPSDEEFLLRHFVERGNQE